MSHRALVKQLSEVVLILVIAGLSVALPGVEYLTEAEALKLAFPTSGAVERFEPAPTVEQMRLVKDRAASTAQGKLGQIWVGHSDGQLDGVAIIDHVIGRTEFITYLCVIGKDGRVRRIEVMIYREAFGGEIRDARFLAQFKGIGPDDALRPDRPVNNIAGATMSVDALCERVRFLLDFHAVVLQPGATTWLASRKPAPVAAAGGDTPFECSVVIGTSALTIIIDHGGEAVKAVADTAIAEAQRLDAVLNRWRDDSELASLNAKGTAIVGPDLLGALVQARSMWQATDHLFDPTVSPLILLWKDAAQADRLPDPQAFAAARSAVGFAQVQIDESSGEVRMPVGGSIDLGGIAKGRILDALGAELGRRLPSTARARLAYGESSQLVVASAAAAPVIIALRDPADPAKTLQRIRLAGGRGLGCASATGRVFTIQGQRRSHLVNPLSGETAPLDRAAWVVASSAALADGLDTAFCLLEPAQALRLAIANGAEALIWDGAILHSTTGWPVEPEP